MCGRPRQLSVVDRFASLDYRHFPLLWHDSEPQHVAPPPQYEFRPPHEAGARVGAGVVGLAAVVGLGVAGGSVGATQVSVKLVHFEFLPRVRHSPEQHSLLSLQSAFVRLPPHGVQPCVGGGVGDGMVTSLKTPSKAQAQGKRRKRAWGIVDSIAIGLQASTNSTRLYTDEHRCQKDRHLTRGGGGGLPRRTTPATVVNRCA